MPSAVEELRDHFEFRFGDVSSRVTTMFLGPSDSSVLEVQVIGPDRAYIYETARRVEELLAAAIPRTRDIRQNWENRIARVVVEVDQARARRADVTSADVARTMSAYFNGRPVSEFREGDDVIPIVAQAVEGERSNLDQIRTLSIFGASGAAVPLAQVADVSFVNGFSRIERENLARTVTIEARSDVMGAEDMVPLIQERLDELEAAMPPGHSIEYDGIIAQSNEGRAALLANMPLSFGLIVLLLVLQFNSFRRPVILIMTIPLILVGVAIGLRAFGADFGFMPILGMLSLAGIVMCNAIVLIDRIEIERAEGWQGLEPIVRAGMRRLRPILMTTVTTVLGLMPLIVSVDPLFFGMATVMAAGLTVGAFLTLGFVPVVYSLFFAKELQKRGDEARQRDTIGEPEPAE